LQTDSSRSTYFRKRGYMFLDTCICKTLFCIILTYMLTVQHSWSMPKVIQNNGGRRFFSKTRWPLVWVTMWI